jgi:hypothetical protein
MSALMIVARQLRWYFRKVMATGSPLLVIDYLGRIDSSQKSIPPE